jgi:hypothetical protein
VTAEAEQKDLTKPLDWEMGLALQMDWATTVKDLTILLHSERNLAVPTV